MLDARYPASPGPDHVSRIVSHWWRDWSDKISPSVKHRVTSFQHQASSIKHPVKEQSIMTRTRLAFIALWIWMWMISPLSAEQPKKNIALVIGNNLYEKTPLLSPGTDANTIAKTLEKCNFIVSKGLNLDSTDMKERISTFGQALKEEGGIGIFYFSGHGIQVDGRNYLVPLRFKDFNKEDVKSGCIEIDSIIETMKSAGNPVNIIILDAAYAAPFGKDFEPEKPGLAKMEAPEGFMIISSAQPSVAVKDTSFRQSPFTEKLSKHLITPELDIREALFKVREEIEKATKKKQSPEITEKISSAIHLYYPKRDFFRLLADIKQFTAERKTLSFDEISDHWEAVLDRYPYWSSKSQSEDPIELILAAINENPDENLFEMVPHFDISLKKTNTLDMEFLYIPPGKFLKGSPFDEPNREEDERQQNVTIPNGFFMQATEVTQGQWMAVMGNNPSAFDECGPDCPVENVSWDDVQEFVERLNTLEDTDGYRLPSETEWEYAARAGSTGWFCFGSNPERFPDYAWYKENSANRTHPVSRKMPNEWGLYDVHGNVWEWCQEKEGDYHLIRGGSWFYSLLHARCANRFFAFPDDRNYTIGFRLVKTQ